MVTPSLNNSWDKSNDSDTNTLQIKRALNDKETSAYIGMSKSWLRQSRVQGTRLGRIPPPPFIKIGRSVRYLIEDLDVWLEKFQKLDHLSELVNKPIPSQ